ncbi:hypothetical protein EMIT0347P_20515 [Pseudomonas sp. IT-347P]
MNCRRRRRRCSIFSRLKISGDCEIYPLTPTLSPTGARGKGSQLGISKILSSTRNFQVDALPENNSVSSLSPRGARGKGANWGFLKS